MGARAELAKARERTHLERTAFAVRVLLVRISSDDEQVIQVIQRSRVLILFLRVREQTGELRR